MNRKIRRIHKFAKYIFTFIWDATRVLKLMHDLTPDVIEGKNDLLCKDEIIWNLRLPEYYNGILLDWKSTVHSVNNDGIIIKNEDCDGELIATAHSKLLTMTKRFRIKTIKRSDSVIVAEAVNELTFEKICGMNTDEENVKSNLVLPLVADNGAKILWETEGKVTDGTIIRDDIDKRILLEATVFSGEEYAHREFNINIKAQSNSNEKILVMVPHGDDEMLLASSVMYKGIKEDKQLYVCFYAHNDCNTTDRKDTADGKEYASHRNKETIEALGYLGIAKENIIILGYGNGQSNNHIYDNKTEVCSSRAGFTHTYGTQYLTDYHTLKHGGPAEYTHDNVVNDICELIEDIMPNEIYAVDLDAHTDHRAFSLFFDEAIYILLSKQKTYRPKIFKGFAYCTSGYASEDFIKFDRLKPTLKPKKINLKSCGETDNPMFLWKDRICIETPVELYETDYSKNPVIQTLLRYGRLYNVVNRFINADSVFWERRTDSLTYDADIFVTSGDGSGICDFKIIDCKSVAANEPDFSAGLWTPTDSVKKVIIEFKEPVSLSEVRIYQNTNKKQRILKGILRFSDESEIPLKLKKSPYYIIPFALKKNIKWISFEIQSAKNDKFGISEIEAFEKQTQVISKKKDNHKYKKNNRKQWLYVYNKEYKI